MSIRGNRVDLGPKAELNRDASLNPASSNSEKNDAQCFMKGSKTICPRHHSSRSIHPKSDGKGITTKIKVKINSIHKHVDISLQLITQARTITKETVDLPN